VSEASEELSDRIREIIGHRPGVTEKRMFGGRCFLLHGNMLCAAMSNGNLLARVGAAGMEAAAAIPGAVPMHHAGRTMTGFVEISDGLGNEDELDDWLERLWRFTATLPAKPPAPLKARKTPAKR
jgi:TfoX/Sxy family transcriptional regulator of competence genes